MECQRQAVEIGLQVDFAGKSAARAPEGLVCLPPFAPAAETCARTTVESTIWLAGGAGGFSVREPAAEPQSCFCQTADSISGAVQATASATPANAREASIAS